MDGKPSNRDKLLFTPGPLTTSATVKEAMLHDLGSRDAAFIALVRDVRRRLLALGQVSDERYTAVPMQGSGTFSLEAVLASAVPPGGKVLVAVNGAYGRRLVHIGETLGITMDSVSFSENQPIDPERIADALDNDPARHRMGISVTPGGWGDPFGQKEMPRDWSLIGPPVPKDLEDGAKKD